jgi:DNA-binding response OmpR family regulator
MVSVVRKLSNLFFVFGRITMNAVANAKVTLTNAQMKLLAVLKQAAGQKNVDEIAEMYGKAMGHEVESGSITTSISQLRKTIKSAGKKFPANLEPKRKTGGGRTSERTDLDSALNSLGIEFEDMEVEGEGESN